MPVQYLGLGNSMFGNVALRLPFRRKLAGLINSISWFSASVSYQDAKGFRHSLSGAYPTDWVAHYISVECAVHGVLYSFSVFESVAFLCITPACAVTSNPSYVMPAFQMNAKSPTKPSSERRAKHL